MLPYRRVYDEEHSQFRETVRRFAASKIAPNFERWEDAGIIERSLLNAGGAAGLLCPQVPEEFGGAGGDCVECSRLRSRVCPGAEGCAVDRRR